MLEAAEREDEGEGSFQDDYYRKANPSLSLEGFAFK